jgi:cell division protease FtsH
MSDAVGPMAVGDSEQEVFLGRDLGQRRQVSERTAQLVDEEIKRLLDDSYEMARTILRDNEPLLESIALALLERETLDREEVETLARGETLPPVEPRKGQPGPPAAPATTPAPAPLGGIGGLNPSPSAARSGSEGLPGTAADR